MHTYIYIYTHPQHHDSMDIGKQWQAWEPPTQLAIDIDDEPNENLGYTVNEPEGPRLVGGHGPPRRCHQNDGIKDFHDGGGLCSPGRWPQHRRGYADGASWDWLRAQIRDIVVRRVGSETELEKEAFRMAMGGENSCKLARDSQLHEELLQLLQKWIEGQDLSEKDLLAIPPGLEAAGDPDRDFHRRAEFGLPWGYSKGYPGLLWSSRSRLPGG